MNNECGRPYICSVFPHVGVRRQNSGGGGGGLDLSADRLCSFLIISLLDLVFDSLICALSIYIITNSRRMGALTKVSVSEIQCVVGVGEGGISEEELLKQFKTS